MQSIESLLKFKPEYKGSYINGEWKKSLRPSGTWESTSPANIDWVLPNVTYSFEHIGEAVDCAKKAQAVWRQVGLLQRVDAIKRFGIELKKRSELIAKFLSLETGKSFVEALAETDIIQTKLTSILDSSLSLINRQSVDLGIQGKGEITYHPKGLLVVIGPFNLGLSLPHGQIIPALLAGNTCIFKPSEKVPYSAQVYMEAAQAAEIPAGVLQMLPGPAEMGIRLVRDTDVDGVLATCSFDVGCHIQKELAEKPQRIVMLEMGAKNGALVWKNSELESVAEQIIRSAFMTTGQRCTALPRVYVERSQINALVARVHELAKNLVVAHPFEEEPRPFMGPLISAQSKERLFRYASIAEGEGAESVMRAKSLEGKTRLTRTPLPLGHYVSPSIHLLKKWDAKSAYQTHEIFAPDVFFCPVDSIEEGIAAVNATGYGLATSFFGGAESDFNFYSDRVDCGLVYWNRGTVGSSSKLPFGGWKKSGNHRPGGLFSILATTQVQSRIKS
jgi:succinylglutamic semialdehyde dehydrogenase